MQSTKTKKAALMEQPLFLFRIFIIQQIYLQLNYPFFQ